MRNFILRRVATLATFAVAACLLFAAAQAPAVRAVTGHMSGGPYTWPKPRHSFVYVNPPARRVYR